jgi:hypothetical protein
LKRGGAFKVLMNITEFSVKNARDILDLSREYPKLELRHWESYWRGMISDKRKVLLVKKTAKSPEAALKISDGVPGSPKDFSWDIYEMDESKQNFTTWVNWFIMVYYTHGEKASIGPSAKWLINELSKKR